MCSFMDAHMTSIINFHHAAIIVGTIHSATSTSSPGLKQSQRSTIPGFRSGQKAVLPAILLEMSPAMDQVGICCIDMFIGKRPRVQRYLDPRNHNLVAQLDTSGS
jgi:hypothetical protein